VTALCRELYPAELADIERFARGLLAVRGKDADPRLISRVLVTLERLTSSHHPAVPLPALRVELPDVPRVLLDRALLAAWERGLLRLRPVNLPAPFVEPSAGIPSSKDGLLYYCEPS
jgi:hypothetical protein